MKKVLHNLTFQRLVVLFVVILLFSLWTWKGLIETGVSADVARDLGQVSNLWMHKIVWLGPNLGIGFPISPLYFYLLFPFLLISGGNGYSLVVAESFFACAALLIFGWYQLKKSFSAALIGVLAIGLAPWWITASSFVWNGNMYVSWTLMGLVLLWQEYPLFLPALLFGIATSIHPMGILVLPLLIYEWGRRDKKILNAATCAIGLALPWSPILLFEVITKGYLIRQWLAHPSTSGVHAAFNLSNLMQIAQNVGSSVWIGIIMWIATFIAAKQREKMWILFISFSFLVVLFTSNLLYYYLYGLTCAAFFLIIKVWSTKPVGRIVLALLIVLFALSVKLPINTVPVRSIGWLDSIVKTVIREKKLDRTKKYAVASLNEGSKNAPQADDYRFFLRMNGYKAVGLEQNNEADLLLLFVEAPELDWKTYENWNIQQFGPRKIIFTQKIDGVIVVMYGRN